MRILSIMALITQIALGNLCLMQMAYAQEMPLPENTHHESMEMVMTPMTPMTPVDCVSCLKIELKQAPLNSISCANGHCLSHTVSRVYSAVPSSHFPGSVAIPVLTKISFEISDETHTNFPSTAPPGSPILTSTIVLLF